MSQKIFSKVSYFLKTKILYSYYHWRNCLLSAGPKIFAARIGLVFSVIILLATLIGLITTALVFATILEAAFGICVACKLYPFLYTILYKAKFWTELTTTQVCQCHSNSQFLLLSFCIHEVHNSIKIFNQKVRHFPGWDHLSAQGYDLSSYSCFYLINLPSI